MADFTVFELTASEVAEMDEDLICEYTHRHEFRLATMNSRTRDEMFDTMIEEKGIKGGYFYCLSDEPWPVGPFESYNAAREAAKLAME